MNGLQYDGCKNALALANEQFEAEMRRLKDALAHASSPEAEDAIQQQMRECEARHRDQIASLQRSVF